MGVLRIAAATLASIAAIGCHSASISATITNRRSTPVTLVEIDYPSASFGVQKLSPGEDFHYRFKVLGSGPTTLLWSEPSKRDQKNSGPELREGDEGSLIVTFPADAPPTWSLQLSNRSVPR